MVPVTRSESGLAAVVDMAKQGVWCAELRIFAA
jgi:hypothetical protein